jgi:heptosyltransferase-2
MPVYPASASAKPAAQPDAPGILLVGLNWLGDSIMSMPAIQAYRQAHPEQRLLMLVKAKLAALWTLHAAIDEIIVLPESSGGMLRLARQLAGRQLATAFILPNSFRAALVPFLARIPERHGLPGHWRDWMLTRIMPRSTTLAAEHQSHEYLALLGLAPARVPEPRLTLTAALRQRAVSRLGAPPPWIALMPGAAYGPAKRWPAEHFISLGRMLNATQNYPIVLLGSAAERDLCRSIAQGIGPATLNLAGQTSLPELAALLEQCALVVANDSGGMHLAAAVGAPVLAFFGITNPRQTGPLGAQVRILQNSSQQSRDIRRSSPQATLSLSGIRPEQAWEAARELLAKR